MLGSVWRGERPQLSGADAEHAYHSQDDLTEAGGWRHQRGRMAPWTDATCVVTSSPDARGSEGVRVKCRPRIP